MKLTYIKTAVGDKIMEDLAKEGWKKIKEYSLFAFDKGIDFDSYTFKRGDAKLKFEWTNWFEWEVIGSENDINALIAKYALEKNKNK